MTADVIQFVPGLKAERFQSTEADLIAALKFDQAKINQEHAERLLADTSPCEYVQDSGDCA